MKRIFPTLMLFLLSGCFLDQHKPNPPGQPASGSVSGVIGLQDLSGAEPGAIIIGLFTRKTDSPKIVGRIEARPETMFCETMREPIRAASPFISIGQLSFGTALQSTHLVIPEDEHHRYVRELSADFPAGTYTVAASGITGIQPFQVLLQLPEALQDVTANAQAFGSSSMLLRKSEDLILGWRQPALPNSDQLVILNIDTKSATENIRVSCLAYEQSMTGAGGTLMWRIPKEHLSQLAEMKDATIYFSRANIADVKESYLQLQVQGKRTWYSILEIGG